MAKNSEEKTPLRFLVIGTLLCLSIIGIPFGIPLLMVYFDKNAWKDACREHQQAKQSTNSRKTGRTRPEYLPLDLLPSEMEITYVDASGEKSVRLITTKEIEKSGRTIYIHAFCHERKAARTFKLSGIKKAVDTSTGEFIDLKTFRAAVS